MRKLKLKTVRKSPRLIKVHSTNNDKIMNATKEELVRFLEENVLIPTENNPDADVTIRRKINATRMRLNNQVDAEKVRQYFWSAMASDNGIDSYNKISNIGAPTFEDVRVEFKRLCGDK